MTDHAMLTPQVTRFHRGVPVEVAADCECGDLLPIRGTGASLTECRTDLLANFADHAGYADRAARIRAGAS